MKESELVMSRRRFVLASAKAATGVAIGLAVAPELLEALDRIAPRRLLIPGVRTYPVLNFWKESSFTLTDKELRDLVDFDLMPMQAGEARKALAYAFDLRPVPVRVSIHRQFRQTVFSYDAIGQDPVNRVYSLTPQPTALPPIDQWAPPRNSDLSVVLAKLQAAVA